MHCATHLGCSAQLAHLKLVGSPCTYLHTDIHTYIYVKEPNGLDQELFVFVYLFFDSYISVKESSGSDLGSE